MSNPTETKMVTPNELNEMTKEEIISRINNHIELLEKIDKHHNVGQEILNCKGFKKEKKKVIKGIAETQVMKDLIKLSLANYYNHLKTNFKQE
jgi:hypothetical protein